MGEIDVEVWEPEGHEDAPLPLLLVHDGAEMDAYGGVVRYAATRPPMRVGLLSPGSDRDERYAANPAYAAALVGDVIPALIGAVPTTHEPVLLGQSLGGLAALHAAWLCPDAFAGLVLQSGSFFTPVLDPQESGYAQFDQVVGFVASLPRVDRGTRGVPAGGLHLRYSPRRTSPTTGSCTTHLADLGVPSRGARCARATPGCAGATACDPHLGDLLDAGCWV